MINLPWSNKTAPNVMIDILDKCNITCSVCYKRHSNRIKSMDEIKHDVEVAAGLRDLQVISISGGEPTLHPDLLEVVSLIKGKGFHTIMLTNGILLDDDFIFRLKSAGLDSILFHIDTGQNRPDLPKKAGLKDIQKRLFELVDRAIEVGIDVSFSWTILEYSEEEIDFVIKMFLDKPDVSFLFLSKGTDPKSLPLNSIKLNEINKKAASETNEKVTESMQQLKNYFTKKFSILPFAYIPAVVPNKKYLKYPIFISYFLPIIYRHNSINFIYRFKSNLLDKILMYIPKIIKGYFIHKTTQNATLTAVRVLFNGFSRLRLDLLLRFFISAYGKNTYIRNKMIVYDDGPLVLNDGSVGVCEYCPTAILKNDKLVRCCEIYHLSE